MFANINHFLKNTITRITALTGWRRYLLAFFSGVGGTLSMAPYYLLPLLILGLSSLLVMNDDRALADSLAPLRRSLLTGWAFGFGYFLTGLYWMGFAFLARGEQFIWMLPFAIPAFAMFLGIFYALPTALHFSISRKARALKKPFTPFISAVFFAVFLSGFEYLRGHILTGLPWNSTGQAMTGLIAGAQTASLYGVYGLGLVVLLLSLLLVSHINIGKYKSYGWPITLIGFTALYLIGFIQLGLSPTVLRDDIRVSIIQPNIRQKDKINPALASQNFQKLLRLSANSKAGRTQNQPSHYMVWPENAVSWIKSQPIVLDAINASISPQTTILSGSLRQSRDASGNNRFYNTLAILEDEAGERTVTQYYDKHHLVPFGEYLPLKALLRAIGLQKIMPVDEGFSPGPGPQTLPIGPAAFAPLICYEAIFPGAMYPKGERPQWLVTITNDAWFGDGAGPKQHLDQARLRTIETGLPMLRSANTGISAVIDANGRVIDMIPLYEEGVLETNLPNARKETIYSRFGDALYFLMMLMATLGVILSVRKQAPQL